MSSKTKVWAEEDFRRELRKIDEHVRKTQGIILHGADLDIEFSEKARRTLGVYNSKDMKFRFSLPFFNSDVPEECAIGVIKHEYAHYYSDVIFGYIGHGKMFKTACCIVGAVPSTYYLSEIEASARRSEEMDTKVYESSVKIGQIVLHPSFGEGKVVTLKNKKISALLTIDFGKYGVKSIDEMWLRENGVV